MSPQFVDFNKDGQIDIVAGTFSGSPYLAIGTAKGFEQPDQIRDRDGERILLNQFWNYETKKWDETNRCDPEGGVMARGHGTSAWATDWDHDGDYDLLLGDYDGGVIYLRLNEGSATNPAFAKKNILLEADGKPIKIDKTATMRIVDWNGDGHGDLLLGSMGDTYRDDAGGGVWLFPGAESSTMSFGAPITLVQPSPKGAHEPTRPDAGLYIDLHDHEGDGDLDLIVGGYSMWTPKTRKLDNDEKARVRQLRTTIEELDKVTRALGEELREAMAGLEGDELRQKAREIREAQSEQRTKIRKQRQPLKAELDELVPTKQRKSYVWLYENLGTQATEASSRQR